MATRLDSQNKPAPVGTTTAADAADVHAAVVDAPPVQAPQQSTPPTPARSLTAAPKTPGSVTGPPIDALVKSKSYFGSIHDLNDRVQTISDAYTKTYGIPPTPGLVLDLAASKIDTHDLPNMFNVPLSQQNAKAKAAILGASQRHPVDFSVLPPANAADVVTGLADAIRKGQYSQYMAQHHDELADALLDPRYHDEIAKAALSAYQPSVSSPKSERAQLLQQSERVLTGRVLDEQVFPSTPTAFGRFFVLDPLRAYTQIATGLTLGLPVLGFKEGQATYESAKQKSLKPLAKENVALAKQSVQGVKQDFEHPEANAGNLFLDILGIASIGGGTVARLSAAGRAALEGEGAAAAARALVTRPAPGTFTMSNGGATAETLLSDNAAVRAVQRAAYTLRQAGMDARHDLALTDVPAGAQSAFLADRLSALADSVTHPLRGEFSFENKFGRTVLAEQRVEQAIRSAVAAPMNQAAHLSVRMTKLGPRIERGLSVGEQKALQVLMTDVAGGPAEQLAANRAMHERFIDLGIGDEKAHRNQLQLLNLAEKVLSKPPRPKFAKALQGVADTVDEMERLKADQLGLDPTTGESRVARVGAIIRGEATHEPAFLTDAGLQSKIAGLESQLADNLARQEQFKAAPRSAERAAGGNTQGLSPDATLRGLRREESQLRDQIDAAKAETKPIDLKRVNPESRYLPYTSAARKGASSQPFFGPQIGPYGVPVPGSMPELNHEFTGHYLKAGDFRVDATGLTSEAYGRTVRVVTKLNAWRRLWKSSVPHPPANPNLAKFYEPVRDVSGLTDNLRRIVNKVPQGEITSEEAAALTDQEITDLEKFLLPDAASLTPADMQHIRWFDRRTLGDTRRAVSSEVGRKAKKGFAAGNELVRDFGIYFKPSYALNLLNSASMAVIEQGAYAIPNMFKALTAESRWDPQTARMLDAMAGEGRTLSYIPDVNLASRVGQAFAQGWNKLTDQFFRRSMAIHWLHRLGVTDEEIPNVLKRSLTDPEAMKLVSEASRRAKKGAVELDNLRPIERDWLRHIIFVYPWTSRSLVWSLRTLVEHPIQSTIYNEIGKETEQEFPEILKRLPTYMKELGYFPVGWTKDGTPKLVNPGSVNTFSTLAEFAGLADGTSTLDSLFGPGAELALHIATNRDQWGRTYKTPVVGPITDMIGGLPQYAAVKRAQQKLPGQGKAPLFTAEGPQFYGAAFEHNKPFAKPGPYQTKLSKSDEAAFRQWVSANHVPFDPNAKTVDYDMRGYWLAQRAGKAPKWAGGNTHFPDTFKTPYDTTFSAESKYATPDNPFRWNGESLVDTRNGNVVFGPPPEPGAGLDMTNDRALIDQQNAALKGDTKQPIFVPQGYWSVFGPLAAGGLWPRVLDKQAVNARFWKNAPLEQRHEHEKQLIEQMITLQGQLLKQPVPHQVLDAVNLASDLDLQFKQFAAKSGRGPTAMEKAGMALDFLAGKKRINAAEEKQLRAKLDKLPSAQLGTFTNGLYREYADGKALSQWHDDVRTVAGFTPDSFAYQVNTLRNLGVDNSANLHGLGQNDLHELGRRFLDYEKQVAQMTHAAAVAHGVDKTDKQAELQQFIETHDVPVKINGHTFPSLPRLDVARMTDTQRGQLIRSLATRNWDELGSLDRALLGRPSDPSIVRGWQEVKVWLAEAKNNQPLGEPLPANAEQQFENYVAKKVPGFRQDMLFQQMPLAQRLQLLPKAAPPAHKDLWSELLAAASQRYSELKRANETREEIAAVWQHHDVPILQEWIARNPDFKKEIDAMGTDFLYRLVG